jgi:hypothetical protein
MLYVKQYCISIDFVLNIKEHNALDYVDVFGNVIK